MRRSSYQAKRSGDWAKRALADLERKESVPSDLVGLAAYDQMLHMEPDESNPDDLPDDPPVCESAAKTLPRPEDHPIWKYLGLENHPKIQASETRKLRHG